MYATEEGLRAVELLLLLLLSSSSSSSHRRHIKEMKMWQCSTNENTNEF